MEKWPVLMRILAQKLGKCDSILSQAQTTNPLSMILMGQMMLSEPSIIII
jgi:hypothetical protein